MRLRNWNVAIKQRADELVGSKFIWGETDCVSVIRIMAVEIFGEDVFAGVVPGYTTEIGAKRALSRVGDFNDLAVQAGCVEVPRTMMTDGDLIISDYGDYQNVAMVVGGKLFVASVEEGLQYMSLRYLADDSEFRVYRIDNG